MQDRIHRSSTSRIFSFIVLLGLIPAWFFYLGVKYWQTMDILEESRRLAEEQYMPH